MKTCLVLICSFFLLMPAAFALDWAYSFVVYDGRVYEVHTKETVEKASIGRKLGSVKTAANDRTGRHYGNASNMYAIGTPYYAIHGMDSSMVIAVQLDGRYVRATFQHEARFHILNIVLHPLFISSITMLGFALFVRAWRRTQPDFL